MTPSRHVYPTPRKRRSQSTEDFFDENVAQQGGDDDCWIWGGGTQGNGYGRIHHDGRRVLVHRYAYERFIGQIPEGFDVDHTCHNDSDCTGGECSHRRCVNPKHLEAVPPVVNRSRSHLHHANRTHCPAGHAYTLENTIIRTKSDTGRPFRSCRECAREWGRRPESLARSAARRRKGPRPKVTHCPRGHLLEVPNLCNYARSCLACHRARARRQHWASKGVEVDLKKLSDEYYASIVGGDSTGARTA